jgi:DNA-binding response OmpR family regulator
MASSPTPDDKRPVILIVDDEESLRQLLRYHLEIKNYDVLEAADGRAALTLLNETKPDLILLDLMLPHVSGLGVLEITKANPALKDVPIIVLSIMNKEEDRVLALGKGADDYVIKPYSPDELIARINTVLRGKRYAEDTILCFGDVAINLTRHLVTRNGQSIRLTATERNILRHMVENPKAVMTEKVYSAEFSNRLEIGQRSFHSHMGRMRQALNDEGHSLIVKVSGVGYKLGVPES